VPKKVKQVILTDIHRHSFIDTIVIFKEQHYPVSSKLYLNYDVHKTVTVELNKKSIIRENKFKLKQTHSEYNVNKLFFKNIIMAIWNSLPDFVVDAHNFSICIVGACKMYHMIRSLSYPELETTVSSMFKVLKAFNYGIMMHSSVLFPATVDLLS